MIKEIYENAAQRLYETTDNPALRYKTAKDFLGFPYDGGELTSLRPAFLSSDIVTELRLEQGYDGAWGALFSKDYSDNAKIPTTAVGIGRAKYIGLEERDGDILLLAADLLCEYLSGAKRDRRYEKNERAPHFLRYTCADLLESIRPRSEACDNLWFEWVYVAGRAFASGNYDYESDKNAQNELFGIREKRLVPLPVSFLLKRHEDIPVTLCDAMLRYFGKNVIENGHIWGADARLTDLSGEFFAKKTRRRFFSIHYINMFPRNSEFLASTVDWLLCAQKDGMWDYGPQTADPWGYFENFSCEKRTPKIRREDCTAEVLTMLGGYIKSNSLQ